MDYTEATEWLRVLINNTKLSKSITITDNNIITDNDVHKELHNNGTFINICKYIKYGDTPQYWAYLFFGYIIKYKTELDNLKKPPTFVSSDKIILDNLKLIQYKDIQDNPPSGNLITPDEFVDGVLKKMKKLEATNNLMIVELKYANDAINKLKSENKNLNDILSNGSIEDWTKWTSSTCKIDVMVNGTSVEPIPHNVTELQSKLDEANTTIALLKSKLEEKDFPPSPVTDMEDNILDSNISVNDLKAALSSVSKRDVYIPCKSCKNPLVVTNTGSYCTTCDPVCTKTTTVKLLYDHVPNTTNEEILNVLKQSNIDYDQYMLQLKDMCNKCNKYSIESKAKVEYMTKLYNKLLKENTLLRQKDELLTNELMEVRKELNMHIDNDYLSSLNGNIDTVNTNVCLLKGYIIKLLAMNDYESTISQVPSVVSSKTSSTSSYIPKGIHTTHYSDTPEDPEEDSEEVSEEEEDSEEVSEEEVVPVKKAKNKHKK